MVRLFETNYSAMVDDLSLNRHATNDVNEITIIVDADNRRANLHLAKVPETINIISKATFIVIPFFNVKLLIVPHGLVVDPIPAKSCLCIHSFVLQDDGSTFLSLFVATSKLPLHG